MGWSIARDETWVIGARCTQCSCCVVVITLNAKANDNDNNIDRDDQIGKELIHGYDFPSQLLVFFTERHLVLVIVWPVCVVLGILELRISEPLIIIFLFLLITEALQSSIQLLFWEFLPSLVFSTRKLNEIIAHPF